MSSTDWRSIGAVPPDRLVEARLSAHFAAQPLAAAAYGLMPAAPDHSHANLLFEDGVFRTRPFPTGCRGWLDVAAGRIGLSASGGAEVASLAVAGRTLADLMSAFAEALSGAGESVPEDGLVLPEYDLPDSAPARGEPFPTHDAAGAAELALWFENATAALASVARARLRGAEVRGWPHHFDTAALLTLDADLEAEDARSVGAGFSPGDGSYAQPYFYVSPWPYPSGSLPELPPGVRWHTEGFTAAVLEGSTIAAAGDEQGALVTRGLEGAVDACLQLSS